MNTARIEQLLAYLEADPDDPFLLYALATEYNQYDTGKALFYYEKLAREHPDYVATYYHLANLYLELEQPQKAKETFESGIEKAAQNNESLLLRELKNAYDEFLLDF